MSSENVANFMAMSGVDAAQATMWLEMAGGDIGLALDLMFGGGAAAPAPAPAADDLPDFFSVVWPDKKEIPDFWLQQDLQANVAAPDSQFGLLQRKNGPCGLLAVVQAELVAALMRANEPALPNTVITDDLLATALGVIIARCRPNADVDCVLVDWKDNAAIGKLVSTTSVAASGIQAAVLANITAFKAPGGAVLLLYSCLLSRTVDQVIADMRLDSISPPLVVGKFWLCSFELMSLLMRGVARGNIGAYNPMAPTSKVDWKEDTGVGLISRAFQEQAGMPVCDRLMRPSLPIWILHGGDHFTTLWSAGPLDQDSKDFTLYQFNGLPPAGPRMVELKLHAPKGQRALAPEKHQKTFFKPLVGEIDGVVQAHADDKKANPDGWKQWRYEVVLAFDDPNVEGADRPDDAPKPPVFEQGPVLPGPWRCTRCYADRFKTFNFKTNPDGATNCEGCGRSREEAGWSLWMTYEQLGGWQGTVLNRFAPKIITVLNAKWPGCEVVYEGEKPSL